MFRILLIALALLIPFGLQAQDAEGSADYPLIGRYENSTIYSYATSDFDEARLRNAPWTGESDTAEGFQKLEGRTFRIVYELPEGRSSLEVFRNLTDSMASNGFEPIFSCADETCTPDSSGRYRFADLLSGGDPNVYNSASDHVRYILAKANDGTKDVYAALLVGEGSGAVALVNVVEVKAMEADKVVFLKSSDMAEALALGGRVALYGIYFDTDSDRPKPESQDSLAEIAKLLTEKPDLNLVVAGHTDNEGSFDYNVDLSLRRAKAVVAALVKDHGIDAGRLIAFGNGMTSPVASNMDEAGRAKNRRVELVQR